MAVLRLISGWLSASVFLLGCSGEPTIATGAGVHKMPEAKVKLAYIDPNVDMNAYRQLLVKPLALDNVRIAQPPRAPGARPFVLNEADKQLLRDAFREAAQKYLQDKGGYILASEAGTGVLTLRVAVVTLAPEANKVSPRLGGRAEYSRDAGTMTIAAQLSDSVSGKTVAVVGDSERGASPWGKDNRAGLQRTFAAWMKQLREQLSNWRTR